VRSARSLIPIFEMRSAIRLAVSIESASDLPGERTSLLEFPLRLLSALLDLKIRSQIPRLIRIRIASSQRWRAEQSWPSGHSMQGLPENQGEHTADCDESLTAA
jgi:hypothetical protein